jgi:hypothetical protein
MREYKTFVRLADQLKLIEYKGRIAYDFRWVDLAGKVTVGKKEYLNMWGMLADAGRPIKHTFVLGNINPKKDRIEVNVVERMDWRRLRTDHGHGNPYWIFTHRDTWIKRSHILVLACVEEIRTEAMLRSGRKSIKTRAAP